MNLKYFYYISKEKIDMLNAQLEHKKIQFMNFNPKITFSGFSVTANVKTKHHNIINDTLSVIEKLNKKKFVKSIDQVSALRKKSFYHDDSIWFNGLFYYDIQEVKIASYFIWKYWNNSIILLIGSPLNIIGEKTMQKGIYAPGTHLAWDSVINFMTLNFQTDENNLLGISRLELIDAIDKQKFAGIPISASDDWEMLFRNSPDMPNVEPHHEMQSKYERYNNYELGALDLGLFCVKYLSALPQNNIDTLFKVTRKIDLRRPTDLPKWIAAFGEFSTQANLKDMERYRHIYLGSPIYTALS